MEISMLYKGSLSKDLKFRQIKVLLDNGRFYNIKRKVCNENQLRKALKRFRKMVYKMYWSNCLWINPHLLKGKKLSGSGFVWLSNLFLSKQDAVFDFDCKDQDIEQVKLDALRLIRCMKRRKNYVLKTIFFSGNHGLHVTFADIIKFKSRNPFNRQFMYERRRKRLLSGLPFL